MLTVFYDWPQLQQHPSPSSLIMDELCINRQAPSSTIEITYGWQPTPTSSRIAPLSGRLRFRGSHPRRSTAPSRGPPPLHEHLDTMTDFTKPFDLVKAHGIGDVRRRKVAKICGCWTAISCYQLYRYHHRLTLLPKPQTLLSSSSSPESLNG
ncbi:hypothetical protein M440DRAFT_1236305 [Trichoderma longibrachiatum ATCC 18648]|uniref:Uncharacterized protein n=1 Tax=Trichoderma longibrachiatum ATCC 18648 TaxID=983965 RepID=A0A2T4C5N9_TRILO|nr:hypothetical protein M440DRAFT_1236305 [Trichoderma longibrachiatum ATCC 18648]